jgi:hypothetical protein
MNLPLASQDGDLRAAAKKEGVVLFEPTKEDSRE